MRHLRPRYSGLVIGLMIMISPTAFCENSVTLTLQYDMYSDGDSPQTTGVEMSAPFQLTYALDRFAVTLQTAYAYAEAGREESDDFTLSGATDTFVSASYTHPFQTRQPTKIIINLDLNLPSGKATLDAGQAFAESGLRSDLFRIDDFGEGLNVGGTLGFERQIGGSTFGLYGGYTYYGQYDPRSDQTDDEYDPGDEIFAGALYEWKGCPRYTLQAYLGYSYFNVDAVNEADTFKIGDKLTGGTNFQAGLLEKLDMALSLQYIMQFKSQDALNGNLVEEPENSNGDELFGSFGLTYRLHPRFSLQLVSEARYYGESDREREDLELPFEGRRVRYSGGSGLEYRIPPSIAFHALGSYFYLKNEPNINVTEDREFQGMNLDVGVTYTF